MPAKKTSSEKRVYQLKVTLRDISPPISRSILVPYDIRLDQLHRVLQIVMRWEDSHLHKFVIDGVSYKPPYVDRYLGDESKDETKFNLYEVAPREKGKFDYVYDFGDNWEHEILVEKILPVEKGIHYPVCITGKRACPPEDCGGTSGYEELLKVLQDPSHPEHEETFEWLYKDFDAEKFDIELVNKRLAGSQR